MATKEQIELNKKKQQFLNLNGIKVKVDGSWGPWQQKQYEKLTTKNKHYQTTPLGFLSQLYDRTLGEGTTYQEDPAFVSGHSGEIKQDNRSNARRYLDSQMKNNKTPLGYITQTVLPAAAVSSTIVYGGPALVQGVKTAVTNPSTVLSALKTFGKETVKGIAGATAVNVASEVTTGKTWGENIAQSTGMNPNLGEFTNPGFISGPIFKFLKPSVQSGKRIIKFLKNKRNNNLSTSNQFKSELDWSPKSWFEEAAEWKNYNQDDIKSLQSHIPEYLEIEKTSKSNGTWLKMPDGSTWEGDPRSWVQLMSKDGQKLSKKVWWHGDDNIYITKGQDVTPEINGKRLLWGSSKPSIARSYTGSDKRVVPIVLQNNKIPLKHIDAEERIWRSAYKEGEQYFDTNYFSNEFLKDGEYLVIDNVIDKGSRTIPKSSKYFIDSLPNESFVDYLIRTQKANDIIIGKNTPRKYLIGNNGNFNFFDPNVFRVLTPLTGFSYVYSGYNNK